MVQNGLLKLWYKALSQNPGFTVVFTMLVCSLAIRYYINKHLGEPCFHHSIKNVHNLFYVKIFENSLKK